MCLFMLYNSHCTVFCSVFKFPRCVKICGRRNGMPQQINCLINVLFEMRKCWNKTAIENQTTTSIPLLFIQKPFEPILYRDWIMSIMKWKLRSQFQLRGKQKRTLKFQWLCWAQHIIKWKGIWQNITGKN